MIVTGKGDMLAPDAVTKNEEALKSCLSKAEKFHEDEKRWLVSLGFCIIVFLPSLIPVCITSGRKCFFKLGNGSEVLATRAQIILFPFTSFFA